MLSITSKRILQGPSMIIDAKNCRHIFEAIQFRQFKRSLQHVKVTLNRAYLDRLEQFLADLPEAERKWFALYPTNSCSKVVSYPLACKAFNYILEEGVQTFVEIVRGPLTGFPVSTYQQKEVLVQENLKVADNTIKEVEDEAQNIPYDVWRNLKPIPCPPEFNFVPPTSPSLNCFCAGEFVEGNAGPGLGREVLEQENHNNPPSIKDRA